MEAAGSDEDKIASARTEINRNGERSGRIRVVVRIHIHIGSLESELSSLGWVERGREEGSRRI